MQRSSVVQLVLVLLVFGIVVPWWKGYDFLDPVILVVYGILPLVFVSPMAARAAAESDWRPGLRRSISLAWAIGAAATFQSLLTIHVKYGFASILLPPGELVFGTQLASLAGTIFIALLTVAITMKTRNPSLALSSVRMLYLAVLIMVTASAWVLPPAWRIPALTNDGIVRATLIAAGVLSGLSILVWRYMNPARRKA